MVRVTAIYNRYRRLIHHEPLLIVAGSVQRQEGVVNILARQVMALPDLHRFCGK